MSRMQTVSHFQDEDLLATRFVTPKRITPEVQLFRHVLQRNKLSDHQYYFQ